MNIFLIISFLAFYQFNIASSQLNLPSLIDIGPTSNPNETVNDVLKFGTNIINTLSEKVNTLPASARRDGQNLVADAREGLQSCESAFMRNGTAWEYKECCSTYLKNGMIAFGNLAAESYRSGAQKSFIYLSTFIISCFSYIFV